MWTASSSLLRQKKTLWEKIDVESVLKGAAPVESAPARGVGGGSGALLGLIF